MDYTAGVYHVHSLAIREASRMGHDFVETAHELLGICELALKGVECSAVNEGLREEEIRAEAETLKALFGRLGIEVSSLCEGIERRMEKGKGNFPAGKLYHRSEHCKQIFARAGELAGIDRAVNCLHLLAAIMENPAPPVDEACREAGFDGRWAARELMDFFKSGGEEFKNLLPPRKRTEYLDKYGVDLTREISMTVGLHVVDRKEELLRLERALLNARVNPVLVGEVGVGKETLVRAIAGRIARGDVPHELRKARIVKLVASNLLEGEEVRPGRLLERLMKMIVEARENRWTFFYIDDVNLLAGSGLAINRDVANVLLPAVINGEVRCILATDSAGYHRHIAENPRLSGRFARIEVSEPSDDVVLEILRHAKRELEEEYPLRITEDALIAAVRISRHMDTGVAMPEKAVDLLHEACALVRLPTLSSKHKVDTIFTTRWLLPSTGDSSLRLEVSGETIKDVAANKAGLPAEAVVQRAVPGERLGLDGLEAFLKSRIAGQDDALESICGRIISAYAGLMERKGPLAVFLFLGPTGVGKTETARLLAERLFGTQDYLLRIDMSEYMEAHAVARLIGSPPGYVGYEEEGALTGWLRMRPHSVVLLDEIEKAHPKVFDLFLQVFDSGRITDAKGRTSDARNAIFVMTSNLEVWEVGEEGNGASEEWLRQRLEGHFRREFLNRIDRVVLFRHLGLEHVKALVKPVLEGIATNLKEKYSLDLRWDEQVLDFLAQRGYDQRYGARELKRTLQKILEEPLSRKLIGAEFEGYEGCRLRVREQRLEIIPEK